MPFRPESSARLIRGRRALSQDRPPRTNVQFRVCHDDRPMPLRLSVLDQSPISAGMTGGDALRNSVDLARHAEQLGYTRYWVAEHHATPMLACASPEVLISAIGAATTRIRVGSGGVMLPHYSPLKVAENFSMLSGLYGASGSTWRSAARREAIPSRRSPCSAIGGRPAPTTSP